MPLFHRPKPLEQALQNTKKSTKKRTHFFSFLLKICAVIVFFIGLAFLSFWKQMDLRSILSVGQFAKSRLIARISFEYISDLKTQALKEERRQMVPPVYQLDTSIFYNFSQKIEALKQDLNTASDAKKKAEELQNLLTKFENTHYLSIEKNDIETLLRLKPNLRNHLLEEGLFIVQEITKKGICEDSQSFLSSYPNNLLQNQLLTLENALQILRTRIFSLTNEYDLANALFHILCHGLLPNLLFDAYQTQEKIRQFVELTPNVTVAVEAGDVLVGQGQKVTPEIFECYQAYQQALSKQSEYDEERTHVLQKKVFLLALLLSLSLVWLSLSSTRLRTSKRLQIATSILIYFYLLLMRGTVFFCYTSPVEPVYHLQFLSTLLIPTFLPSILMTTLVDVPAGVLLTFFAIGLKTILLSGGLETFLCDSIVGYYFVFLCKNIQSKKHIVYTILRGACLQAIIVFIYSFVIQHLDQMRCSQQIAAIFVSALWTLFLVFLLTPFLEKPFRHTTNMTFLRLTNYNHPLLRKLQEMAPGTYHHSLMVAALSEKVAKEVGANPLICRCCALYHDVGKMEQPNYFTENQKPGENPHLDQPPAVSATILKGHIQTGILLAKKHHLPRILQDVIRQHHGTFWMQYFYQKAKLMKKESETIDETLFRYEGPQPQFKESAIIFLADAIEASSRSLEKTTPEAITTLINRILQERLEDGQLKNCTFTLKELETIRKTFQEALMTMLHTRISYKKIELGKGPQPSAAPFSNPLQSS
ncbi:MAG: HDIG domain-containing protein [Opitutales bacterium]|nr:HDIG domain-containing protein [Opitutales bacterium]